MIIDSDLRAGKAIEFIHTPSAIQQDGSLVNNKFGSGGKTKSILFATLLLKLKRL